MWKLNPYIDFYAQGDSLFAHYNILNLFRFFFELEKYYAASFFVFLKKYFLAHINALL